MKTLKLVNTISYVLLAVTYLAFGARTLFGVNFSDTAIRVLGIITLLTLPAVIFTSIKLRNEKEK